MCLAQAFSSTFMGRGVNCLRIANRIQIYPYLQYFNSILRENDEQRLLKSVSLSSTAINIKEVMRWGLSEGKDLAFFNSRRRSVSTLSFQVGQPVDSAFFPVTRLPRRARKPKKNWRNIRALEKEQQVGVAWCYQKYCSAWQVHKTSICPDDVRWETLKCDVAQNKDTKTRTRLVKGKENVIFWGSFMTLNVKLHLSKWLLTKSFMQKKHK